jgi:GGDEF domain-containing protein
MSSVSAAAGGMSYKAARRLLVAGGLAVLLVTAGVMYARRVDTVEVIAVLLFIPVFLAFTYWRIVGGLVGGVLASLAYLFLRLDAIDQVGLNTFRGHLLSRTVAYLSFGLLGGWAASQVENSLTKLDLYDQIDDASGLYNARFFLEATDLELSRAHRYQTLFSVSLVDIPTAAVATLSRRARSRKLREIGRALQASVRTVDRAIHASDGRNHRFAVVLPETGEEGVRIFTERLAERLSAMAGIDAVATVSVTCPGDEDSLRRLRDEFAQIDRREHPGRPRLIGVSSAA